MEWQSWSCNGFHPITVPETLFFSHGYYHQDIPCLLPSINRAKALNPCRRERVAVVGLDWPRVLEPRAAGSRMLLEEFTSFVVGGLGILHAWGVSAVGRGLKGGNQGRNSCSSAASELISWIKAPTESGLRTGFVATTCSYPKVLHKFGALYTISHLTSALQMSHSS